MTFYFLNIEFLMKENMVQNEVKHKQYQFYFQFSFAITAFNGFLKIATNNPKIMTVNHPNIISIGIAYLSITLHLLSQLGAVGDNLINRVGQELDGITKWFIC